jgi:hypothetical protein
VSNQVNTDLLERARDIADYWTGTLWEKTIDDLIKRNELEQLREIVIKAEAEAAMQEIHGHDVY